MKRVKKEIKYVNMEHKTSLKSLMAIATNIPQGQIYLFFMLKIIRTLSKDHVP